MLDAPLSGWWFGQGVHPERSGKLTIRIEATADDGDPSQSAASEIIHLQYSGTAVGMSVNAVPALIVLAQILAQAYPADAAQAAAAGKKLRVAADAALFGREATPDVPTQH